MSDAFVSLLPNNSTQLERALEQVFADSLPDHSDLKTLWNPDAVPADFLGALAWGLSVDDWDASWTDAIKRKKIRLSYNLHAIKGTPSSIRLALERIGFGGASDIQEGKQQRLFDGSLLADGSENYSGPSWAKYSIAIDLGEDAGLDISTAYRAQKVLEKTAPARCDLTDFNWKSDVQDIINSLESSASQVAITHQDTTPWLVRYDGSHHYDQGILLSYNGNQPYDGQHFYQSYANNEDSDLAQSDSAFDAHIDLTLSDVQRAQAFYNATLLYDGYNESDRLFCEDQPMSLSVTQWHRFDGKRTYGDGVLFFDGTTLANGKDCYATAFSYTGNQTSVLTAY